MITFESYIYEVDSKSVKDHQTVKNRPFLFAIICMLLSMVFYLFKMFNISATSFLLGSIIIGLDRFSLFTYKKNIGNLSRKLIISTNEIIIDDMKINITDLDYLKLNLESFEGQLKGNYYRLWKSDGKDNLIEISSNGNISCTHFWLPSFEHVKKLRNIEFPENVFLSDEINH